MKRREFIALLGGATAAWPSAARAQQSAMPVVGFLSGQSPSSFAHVAAAFREGLTDMGFVEGKNVAIEYRWANGQYDRLPELAAELARRKVAVITIGGESSGPIVAKAAIDKIPIIFTTGSDPVKLGLTAAGVYVLTNMLDPMRLGLLRELVPLATTIAVLLNPISPNAANQLRQLEDAARFLRQNIHILRASTEQDLNSAFATLPQLRVGALQVGADPYFNSRRAQIVALAARYSIPAIYEQREFVSSGGLASYGTNMIGAYRQSGVYVGRILKGEMPSDLPVIQSTKFEFVINLKTAKALKLELPAAILLRVDEAIE